MRVLAAIPHYYNPAGDGFYGSLRQDNARIRALALSHCIAALHGLFGAQQAYFKTNPLSWTRANLAAGGVDVVLCTHGPHHLAASLSLPQSLFEVRNCTCEPGLLGFECHAVLRERLGAYDFYCYLEDDLIVEDPSFFQKLAWFGSLAGPEAVLQPNRYEMNLASPVHKVYIDGDLPNREADQYQNQRERPELSAEVFGRRIRFRRTGNPHSGCFFLTQEQMRHWAQQPYFLDRDCSFFTPLESAATLGIMKAFRVYKSIPEDANFLEIRHGDNRYHGRRLIFGPNGVVQRAAPKPKAPS